MANRFRLMHAFGTAVWLAVANMVGAEPAERILRIGMPLIAETFDPARSDNMQAGMLMAGIYDTMYVLDPLARPAAHSR